MVTVSAPASSSFLPSLYQSRQTYHLQQQQLQQQQQQDMDMEIARPSSSNPPTTHSVSHTDRHSPKREPSPINSPSSSRNNPPTLISSAAGSKKSLTSVNVSLANAVIPTKEDLDDMQIGIPVKKQNSNHNRVEEEEEEGEDEVMSEGVVHMNSNLSPQLKSKSHRFPTISTSASILQQHPQQDSPKTPTSAKTPRTPKQTKAPKLPKTPRVPKRSQNDYQSSSGRGKNNQRDSYGDYFYSPFPPSASPASSPSSPSTLQAQLQLLTHNFVSVQPHSSPTNRFRRIPSSIITANATPPFSPPASPGLDPIRESPFHSGTISTTTSPSKTNNVDEQSGTPTTPTSGSFLRPGSKTTTPMRSHFKPRWHTQPYMMFLALRAMPNRTAARQELIMAAVELDKKFSAEKGLPRVFTGKPGDFDTAAKEYNSWMEQLIQCDWPLCFGIPREGAVPVQGTGYTKRLQSEETDKESRPEMHRAYSSPESKKRGHDLGEQENKFGNSKKVKAGNESDSDEGRNDHADGREDRKVANKMKRLDIKTAGSYDGSMSCPPTPTAAFAAASLNDHSPPCEEYPRIPRYRLEDLDLDQVPTSLADIVRVDVSTMHNSGNGLFAKIDLPTGTPLGFYFGVPMTENEFDSLKDGVGMASQYSIMYRRTVLDATDEHGQPYTDPNGPMYCPFHFMNEDPDGNVSFITGSVTNQVICTTNRDVKAGEELFVFYGKEMDRHWAMSVPSQDLAANGEAVIDGKRSRAGSRSRASSPTRRTTPAVDDTGRPRRETVHKPVRYTR
ncbi:hypothetical protein BGX27_011519 [Mortierella sp. AM989]|nr:hypothetical protein BGX27_011519 [Mortierella sp. AM989]